MNVYGSVIRGHWSGQFCQPNYNIRERTENVVVGWWVGFQGYTFTEEAARTLSGLPMCQNIKHLTFMAKKSLDLVDFLQTIEHASFFDIFFRACNSRNMHI